MKMSVPSSCTGDRPSNPNRAWRLMNGSWIALLQGESFALGRESPVEWVFQGYDCGVSGGASVVNVVRQRGPWRLRATWPKGEHAACFDCSLTKRIFHVSLDR